MLPDREIIRANMPKCFSKFRDTTIIIDCTELFVEIPRDFGRQGNCYSSYKSHTTYKFLIGIAPNGTIIYVSDLFEGAISDKQVVIQSGFLDKLRAGDAVLADRGFVIQDLLNERHVKLNLIFLLF